MIRKLKEHQFLFEELVKRDFKKKYKRTIFGMFWSILSPLSMLCVLAVIFGHLFGRSIPHYLIYLFSGQVIFNYYIESTNGGMSALTGNANIFTKINLNLNDLGLFLFPFFILKLLIYLLIIIKFQHLIIPSNYDVKFWHY